MIRKKQGTAIRTAQPGEKLFLSSPQPASGSLELSPEPVHPQIKNSRGSALALLATLALAVALYFATASSPALMDDDVDATHALVAREMLQRHDYVVIYMNGIRYLYRAPLHFWLIAGSYRLLGESEFATRLPSALAVLGLVLMMYEFGSRFFSQRAGFYAALIVATSPGTFIFTRTVISEPIYAFEFTCGFYLFLRAWTGTLDKRIGYWGAAAVFALAVLTRGLIGVLFPLAAIIGFISVTKGWRRWRELRPVSSALIFFAIAVPWHAMAELRAPGFLWAYFINDHLKRALGTRWPPDYSVVPLWLWWMAHIIWFFPWSFFAPLAVREFLLSAVRGNYKSASSQAKVLLFAWAITVFVFFSIERGSRMEYYSFGAWPAIGLLLGVSLVEAEQRRDRWLLRIQKSILAVGSAAALLLGYLVWKSFSVHPIGDISDALATHPLEYYRFAMAHAFDLTLQSFAHLRAPAFLSAVSLGAMSVAAWMLRKHGRNVAAAIALVLGMIAVLVSADLAFRTFEPELSSHSLAVELNKLLCKGDKVAVYGDFTAASSLAFYTGQRIWLYNAPYSSLQYGSQYPDAPRIFLGDEDFPAFWRGSARVFLVVPRDQSQRALARLPASSTWLVAKSGGKTVYSNRPLAAP
jgi:4-amino-4-deoxy-L-arabinose transferase-like glycosyltransferase